MASQSIQSKSKCLYNGPRYLLYPESHPIFLCPQFLPFFLSSLTQSLWPSHCSERTVRNANMHFFCMAYILYYIY